MNLRGWCLMGVMVAGLAGVPRLASAYPLNPWGGATGKGVLAINPFLYVYPGPEAYPVLYAAYGITDKFDVFAGAGLNIVNGDGVSMGGLELFPRYFLTENLALVAHVIYSPGDSLAFGPELHMVNEWEKISLTVNLGYQPVWVQGGGGIDPGSVFAIIAPEYNFSPRFSVFLEIDPEVAFSGGAVSTALTLVPGVGFSLQEDQIDIFSVGLQVWMAPDAGFSTDNLSIGMWYSRAFGGE